MGNSIGLCVQPSLAGDIFTAMFAYFGALFDNLRAKGALPREMTRMNFVTGAVHILL